MTLTPRELRPAGAPPLSPGGTAIAVFVCLVAAVYVYAWYLPGVTLDAESAAFLVTARDFATGRGAMQTGFLPLFPAVLALFTVVSQQAHWLRILPLVCGLGWLVLTRKLLLRMGASQNSSLLLIALTAASPTVIFLSTSLVPETLFALLATAALLALLAERPFAAGAAAGLATLTRTGGIGLVAACIITLVARRRFRGAVVFAATATLIAAPWFGWSLAQFSGTASLEANEKLVEISRNFGSLLASPFSLLAGLNNGYFVIGTIFLLVWGLWVRRQLVPDLFVFLYSFSLLFWTQPPERYVAPILPLFFWMIWRVIRQVRNREALAAIVLIVLATPLVADAIRILPAHAGGVFPRERIAANDWQSVRAMSEYIRANTPPDAVLLANLNNMVSLSTGRRTVRGFTPNNFVLYYLGRPSVSPDELSGSIIRDGVGWVILTPDRGLAESPSFHASVQALERGDVIEPVAIPGVPRDYQLFKVTAH